MIEEFKGCHHKKLWSEPCIECKIVWVKEGIKTAKSMLEKYEKELKELENNLK